MDEIEYLICDDTAEARYITWEQSLTEDERREWEDKMARAIKDVDKTLREWDQMDELDQLLHLYAIRFDKRFPLLCFFGTDDEELISILKKCLEDDMPYEGDLIESLY